MRTRRMSSSSASTSVRASAKSGARRIRTPSGPHADDPPGSSLPPSDPASCATITNRPCSFAALAAIRSHSSRLAGRGAAGENPRAGEAHPARMSSAPSRARIEAVIECQRSSQISIPTLPNRVSKARTSRPGSTKPALLEEAVGGQEDLAVHVQQLVAAALRRQVRHAVVDAAPTTLVEAQRDIAPPPLRRRAHGPDQLGLRKRDFVRRALHEVPRQHRLGEDRNMPRWPEARPGRGRCWPRRRPSWA